MAAYVGKDCISGNLNKWIDTITNNIFLKVGK